MILFTNLAVFRRVFFKHFGNMIVSLQARSSEFRVLNTIKEWITDAYDCLSVHF